MLNVILVLTIGFLVYEACPESGTNNMYVDGLCALLMMVCMYLLLKKEDKNDIV